MKAYNILISYIIFCLLLLSCDNDDYKYSEEHSLELFPSEIYCLPNEDYNIYLDEIIPCIDYSYNNPNYEQTYNYIVTSVSDVNRNMWEYENLTLKVSPSRQDVGSYKFKVSTYDNQGNLICDRFFHINVIDPTYINENNKRNILLLGDSWTEINTNQGEGYVHYINECFKKDNIIIPTFFGTNTTYSKIRHEGRGGYMAKTWCNPPSKDRPNPLWNNETGEIDFTNYRTNICKSEKTFDLVNIQLGVNECTRTSKCSSSEIKEHIDAFIKLTDEILNDSPKCKVLIQLCGLDDKDMNAFNDLDNGMFKKDDYQSNMYRLREELYRRISKRSDFNISVFWGQAVIGLNRNNYINAIHPNTEGYKEMAYMAVPQMIHLLSN